MTAIAAIHVAKKQLGLDDDTYRELLERETGKRSSKGMSKAELDRVLVALRKSGFKPALKGASRTRPLSGPYAAKAQALWIALWNLGAVEDRRDSALLAFVARQTGIERTEWVLDPGHGRAVIEALKAWCEREGVDWSPPPRSQLGRPENDHRSRYGYKIAIAQYRKMTTLESFWGAVEAVLGHTRPDDGDWIDVMNAFGKRVREEKG